MIEYRSAGKRFGARWAVRGLDAEVRPGEIFGLLGENGAGKTTTIRMGAGLVRPDEGTVIVGGHDMARAPIEAKRVSGYVPDKSYLYEKLTGREFMAFVCSLYSVADTGADALLERLGIGDVAGDLIEGYSHGMRQRLIFASALVHRPRALVVDEPFVGLDPYGVRTITALLRELAADGVAVLLATHSLHIAEDLCDRVAVIHKGEVAATMLRAEFGQERGGLEDRFIKVTSGQSPTDPVA